MCDFGILHRNQWEYGKLFTDCQFCQVSLEVWFSCRFIRSHLYIFIRMAFTISSMGCIKMDLQFKKYWRRANWGLLYNIILCAYLLIFFIYFHLIFVFQSYAAPGLLELLCLYGYSLSIYVPVAFLWTIQIGWLQWSLVILATFLSGGVLLRSLLPVIAGKRYITVIKIHILKTI